VNHHARTALHEAGHAVVADTLGVGVVRAHINEDGTGACFLDLPKPDTHGTLNRDMAITLAGPIAAAKAEGKDWETLDLRALVDQEGTTRDLRCDYAQFAFRKTAVFHDSDGLPFEQAVARAVKWADRELFYAAALAADIVERRWDDVREFAERLINDLGLRDRLTDKEPIAMAEPNPGPLWDPPLRPKPEPPPLPPR
jgi:hypothetical protein